LLLTWILIAPAIHLQHPREENDKTDDFEDDLASMDRNISSSAARGGVINYLFMLEDGLMHAGIWRRFFADGKPGTWRAYAHCVNHTSCRQRLPKELPGINLVETVRSEYCIDLVSPQVQMISDVIAQHERLPDPFVEKFVLVSQTTLPVKPFSTIYQRLTENGASDFCVYPSSQWPAAHINPDGVVIERAAEGKHGKHGQTTTPSPDEEVYLPKTHQWVVLNRKHAEKLVSGWSENFQKVDGMGGWKVFLNRRGEKAVPASRFISGWGCPDEVGVFATIFGPVDRAIQRRSLLGSVGSDFPLRLVTGLEVTSLCDTFVSWPRDLEHSPQQGDTDVVEEVYADPDFIKFKEKQSSPWTFINPTRGLLEKLEASPFLFARKFGGDAPHASSYWLEQPDAFFSIINRTGPHFLEPRRAKADYSSYVCSVAGNRVSSDFVDALRQSRGGRFPAQALCDVPQAKPTSGKNSTEHAYEDADGYVLKRLPQR
jgi:hypothetical protein